MEKSIIIYVHKQVDNLIPKKNERKETTTNTLWPVQQTLKEKTIIAQHMLLFYLLSFFYFYLI